MTDLEAPRAQKSPRHTDTVVFTSRRERRLWGWALAVTIAISSTLALGGTLADVVTNRDLMAVLFSLGALLIGAVIIIFGTTRRPGVAEVGVMVGVAAAYLLVFVRMASEVERSHLIEYSAVAVFVHAALRERTDNGAPVPAPALVAIGLTSAVGISDELLQALIPSRVFDPVDIVFNVLAATMAVTALVVLGWLDQHHRGRDRPRSPV